MKIFTIATIFVLLLGGGISTVAAQTSLPGEVLYPVKTLVEDIELGLVTNPEIKFQIASKLANLRMEEIQELIENEKPVPEQAYFDWQMQLYTVLECALQSENPDAKLLQVREMVMQQARQSNEGELRGEPIPNLYQNTLQSQMNLMDAGMAEPQNLMNELQYMFKYMQKNGKEALEEQVLSQIETLSAESAEIVEDKSSGEILDDYQWMFQTGNLDEDEKEEESQDGNDNHMNGGNQGDNENSENGGDNGGLNGDGNDSSGGQNGGSGGNGGGNGGGSGGGGGGGG